MVREKTALLSLFLSISIFSLAQGPAVVIDSLLDQSSQLLNAGNVDDSKPLAFEALKLAIKEKDSEREAWARYRLANAFQLSGNYVSANEHYTESIELADVLGIKTLLASASDAQGMLLVTLEQFDRAEQQIQLAISICEELNDSSRLRVCLEHQGSNFYFQNRNEQALKYYERSLHIASALGEETAIAACAQNIGEIYREKRQFSKAIGWTNRALEIRLKTGHGHFIVKCSKNLIYILRDSGDLESSLKVEEAMYQMLDSAGISLGDNALSDLQEITGLQRLQNSEQIAVTQERYSWFYLVYALLGFVILILAIRLFKVSRSKKQLRNISSSPDIQAGQLAEEMISQLNSSIISLQGKVEYSEIQLHSYLRFTELINKVHKPENPSNALILTMLTLKVKYDVMGQILDTDKGNISKKVDEIAAIIGMTKQELREEAANLGREIYSTQSSSTD